MSDARGSSAPGEDCPGRVARWLARRHGGPVALLGLALAMALVTRVALLLASLGDVSWGGSLIATFAWGLAFDLGAAVLMMAPVVVGFAALPRAIFRYRWAREIARVAFLLVVAGLMFITLAEWVFWEEFGARFNFIAVDYLVYTTEVIGNIRESYPLPVLLAGVFASALVVTGLVARIGLFRSWFSAKDEPAGVRWSAAIAWVVVAGIIAVALDESRLPAFANNFHRELAKNGVWSFFAAFRANQLDFDQFYATMPADAAFRRVHQLVGQGAVPLSDHPRDLLRQVSNPGPEQRLNVIQITVESLSAGFLTRYGSTAGLTPNLDALASRALVFDRFYATGNRTDRGMEALTLSVPPTPGRSLVKRPHNERLFTLGSVFRRRGYDTAFIYGGYGYFDNMNTFFGDNGYRVIDRAQAAAKDVTFANVWGACDEDLYRWTMREADAAHVLGLPFFHFVMTTSNHRPYTFPDGAIDLPSKTAGRPGGVKYTDHAIGEFLRAAALRPWFKETVFVIVADHCASSAGRAALPVENYHIPLLIYAPGGQIQPGIVDTLTSQIDLAPTLLGLLRWSYPSRFFGRDVLAPGAADERGHALIGNYQRLGLYVGGASANLAVLSPVREMATYHFEAATGETTPAERDVALLADAMAYYQTASFLFKHGLQSEYVPEAP